MSVIYSRNGVIVKQKEDEKESVTIDGVEYPYMRIGNLLWLKKNLEVETTNSKVHPDHPEYGRYYSASAMESLVLPDGWRVPAKADFENLLTSFGEFSGDSVPMTGWILKSTDYQLNGGYNWGNDSIGMCIYPSGHWYTSYGGSWAQIGLRGVLRGSTPSDSNYYWDLILKYDSKAAMRYGNSGVDSARWAPIRLCKDAT